MKVYLAFFFSDFFSLPKHGSNDTGLEKMNTLTVRLFYINKSKVDTLFLNMCCTTSQVFHTTATIFKKIDDVMIKLHQLPCSNCVGF